MAKSLLSWFDKDDAALVIVCTTHGNGMDLECLKCKSELSVILGPGVADVVDPSRITADYIMSHVFAHMQPVRFSYHHTP